MRSEVSEYNRYTIHIRLNKTCIRHFNGMIGDIDVNIRRELDREVLKISHKEDETSQCLITPELKNIQNITGKTNDLSTILENVYISISAPPTRKRLPASSAQ